MPTSSPMGPTLTSDRSAGPPVALSIAGSDSGGGAGIQADLKAFAAAGVHGTTAITAITAQNTVEVRSVHAIPPRIVRDQVAAVAEDIAVDAVKVGMLGSSETIVAVTQALEESGLAGKVPIVIDPVMVAESGAVLLEADAKAALVERLLPLATVATPNLPEARQLSGLGEETDLARLGWALRELGPRAVVVTGGHTEEGFDLLVSEGEEPQILTGPRYPDGAAHGSGCTHSSTLAARLAVGDSIHDAAIAAKSVTAAAVGAGLRAIGRGAGPVDVFGVPSSR